MKNTIVQTEETVKNYTQEEYDKMKNIVVELAKDNIELTDKDIVVDTIKNLAEKAGFDVSKYEVIGNELVANSDIPKEYIAEATLENKETISDLNKEELLELVSRIVIDNAIDNADVLDERVADTFIMGDLLLTTSVWLYEIGLHIIGEKVIEELKPLLETNKKENSKLVKSPKLKIGNVGFNYFGVMRMVDPKIVDKLPKNERTVDLGLFKITDEKKAIKKIAKIIGKDKEEISEKLYKKYLANKKVAA